jgi:hypothetical protein
VIVSIAWLRGLDLLGEILVKLTNGELLIIVIPFRAGKFAAEFGITLRAYALRVFLIKLERSVFY